MSPCPKQKVRDAIAGDKYPLMGLDGLEPMFVLVDV